MRTDSTPTSFTRPARISLFLRRSVDLMPGVISDGSLLDGVQRVLDNTDRVDCERRYRKLLLSGHNSACSGRCVRRHNNGPWFAWTVQELARSVQCPGHENVQRLGSRKSLGGIVLSKIFGKNYTKKTLTKGLKCTKSPGRWGFAQDPTGDLTAFPRPSSWW